MNKEELCKEMEKLTIKLKQAEWHCRDFLDMSNGLLERISTLNAGVSTEALLFYGIVYQTRYAAARKLTGESGCEMGVHGSYNCLATYVAVAGTVTKASRGRVIELRTDQMQPGSITQEQHDKLKTFCKVMDIPYREPAWWLTSLWGWKEDNDQNTA